RTTSRCSPRRRVDAEQEPPKFTVEAAEPCFGLSRLAGGDDLFPLASKPVQIVRMNRRRPAPFLQLLQRQADIVRVMLIKELCRAVRASRPCQGGNGVDNELEIALARRESLFGAFALVNIDEEVVPADNVSVRVAKRKSARLKPAIDT